MPRLFGTDGIRGRYPEAFDRSFVMRLGRAAAEVLGRGHPAPRILIGRDTRASGPEIEAALSEGIAATGGVPYTAGVIPTAAIAHLVHTGSYEAGGVISASHNPAHDNGIKFFGHDGMKLPDAVEDAIETAIPPSVEPNGAAAPIPVPDASEQYLSFLLRNAGRLDGLSVVVDTANGAAFELAPEVYRRAGATVTAIHNAPNGSNINDGCGAVHIDSLHAAVISSGAALGIAHDGDADRLLCVDASGELVDGDQILAICALDARSRGALPGDAVASTVMANLGFRKAMDRAGIRFVETPVGDRYVLERMLAEGIAMGGEQSGHLIFTDAHTTGCGILSALRLLSIMAASGKPLSELAAVAPRLPQVMVNVRDVDRSRLEGAAAVWDEIRAVETELAGDGRVLVRPSGTEPLIRVMVEASTEDIARAAAGRIARVVASTLRIKP